ncbi:MAG: hypothetical protein KDI36_16590 [Pseudomonadales bacterium]|nr:hypothetical protein [Pseudomonadales bacterium]
MDYFEPRLLEDWKAPAYNALHQHECQKCNSPTMSQTDHYYCSSAQPRTVTKPSLASVRVTCLAASMLLVASAAAIVLPRPETTVQSGIARAEADQSLAYASDARIIRPTDKLIDDHYGDPALFKKYIIKRPQALA